MEINIMDYVSQEDIKEGCIEELRGRIRDNLRYISPSDILGNISYQCVFKEIEDLLQIKEEEMKQRILEKTIEIIENLSSYSIFRSKDNYTKEDSLGQKYVIEAVENNKELIQDRVKELLVDFNSNYFKEELQDKIYEVVTERLFGEEN